MKMMTEMGKIVEARGFKWCVRDGYRHIPSQMQYEQYTIQWIKDILEDSSFKHRLFVDIGGNEGLYPVMFSNRFDKIITFEPHPMNLDIMKLNLYMNDVNNVEIVEKAVWSSEVEMKLHQTIENDLVGGVTLLDLPDICEPITVKTITLDSMNLEPDLIKIDIEGGEVEALKGMKNTLTKYHPHIYIELHPLEKHITTITDEVTKFMKDVGYMRYEHFTPTEMIFWNSGNRVGASLKVGVSLKV